MSYTTIDKPSDYFNTKLYTGNGSTNAITGLNFAPDWVWLKGRNVAYSHGAFDTVRGVLKNLKINGTDAEATSANTVTSFDSDGFTLGSEAGFNQNTKTFVSWNWLAGGTASSNTDGSITSSVSANTTAGFSIVSYTGNGTSGATVGHGLGVAPSWYLIKSRSNSGAEWCSYHVSLGETKSIQIHSTNTPSTSTAFWNDTAPTSSVFSLGNGTDPNQNTGTYIAYCFAEKKGYSKFGSYTGNGNSDGTFVYTGFKPAFIIAKESSEARDWQLWDNKRLGYNASGGNKNLIPNKTDTEDTYADIDILSNGFKLRSTSSAHNKSAQTYIYMAFSENPFVTSTGIPCTAR